MIMYVQNKNTIIAKFSYGGGNYSANKEIIYLKFIY